jgi:hypothetical protein
MFAQYGFLFLLSFIQYSSSGYITSITLSVKSSESELISGASILISYSATVLDDSNATSVRLVPYFNNLQYGAEVGFTSFTSGQLFGEAYIPLSWSKHSERTLVLAFIEGWPFSGPTVGDSLPQNAVISNSISLSIKTRIPSRPPHLEQNSALLTLYFETWFTPLNFYWQSYAGGPQGAGMAEAIPVIGRYASVNLDAIRTQAAQFVLAGVDVIVIDWTNNCWSPSCSSWDHRSLGIQELINATDLTFGVYHGLQVSENWNVPRILLLLGLDNGPTTPLQALLDELDYIANSYLGNETAGGISSFVILDGKPLVLIFDGTGADHSDFVHANFTIRWMASQLQSTPDFAKRGYWSWMDGSLSPVVTLVQTNQSIAAEAVTLSPAFFAQGGWLNRPKSVGRSGGLSIFSELSSVLVSLDSISISNSFFLNICQWNEFAGTPNGPAGTSYEDSYSPDLSNDLEPTSPWASAYQRPGQVKSGGGYGYRGLNSLALVRALLSDPTVADGSAGVFIIQPAVGDISNYTSANNKSITLEWVTTIFNSSGISLGKGLLTNTSLKVSIAVDGIVTVENVPAPNEPGPQTYSLDVSSFDARFPHVIKITALSSPNFPDSYLTKWPLSFDSFDTDSGVPLSQPISASATVWMWLPESQV